MSSGIVASFLGAVQASLAVLLTIGTGVIASRMKILKESSGRDISKMCVRLFLPALMITSLGSELHADTGYRYVPVLIWAILYTVISVALGWALKRAFKFPAWTVPAICFNNTTSLPLLLIQSLEAAGLLSELLKDSDDSTSKAVNRAKSYFLVSSMVGNSLTFALGPKLLDDEESPDPKKEQQSGSQNSQEDQDYEHPRNGDGRTEEEQEDYETETTSLLPASFVHRISAARERISDEENKYFKRLPRFLQIALTFCTEFFNAPLIGAIIGGIVGLVPPFHRVFFNEPQDGGVFKAWLTTAIKNVGDLFASLQLVVVGAKLSTSLLRMKEGKASGSLPWAAVLSVWFIRFILWPAVSIALVYVVAQKTNWLDDDPILWFVLMLLPTGPPATKLTALGDVTGINESEKMSIAKFLTISYAISPIICLAVVGSLKASLAVTR